MGNNSGKIILDLCGGTGAWSKPYKDAGYTVHVITLPNYSVTDWWIVDNVIRFRKNDPRNDGMAFLEVPINNIHGILAAPPCTHFSLARTVAKIPRDFTGGMQTVESCMRIIWAVQSKTKIGFWVLENPLGYLRRFLGIPRYTFKQWQFGDGREKPTDLWGYFTNPVPTVDIKPIYQEPWGNESGHDGYDRAAVRAITPQGFATAFYKANK